MPNPFPDTGHPDGAGSTPPSLAPLYEVVRVLGRGGMATVYLARETKHGRQVAVKVLDRDDLEESGASRFLFEIHLTARLSHPHIVPLLDSGRADGRPFYVMPFVDGGTLRRRTERGPLETPEALKFAGEVADALAYAHAQGVLHRDVKPENIILSGRSAVVTDFGIARALEAVGAHITDEHEAGIVWGTPAYMSPEQAAGDSAIDERTDVYSLGAVIYEMLTGDVPFSGDTAHAVIAQRFTLPPPSPRARRAEVHEAVDALVRRAMAFEPADRYASAAELGDAIERVARAFDDRHVAGTDASVARAVPSVAILPFDNTTGDADDDFLASGITDEVLTSLARGGAIRVAGRGSSFAMAGPAVDVREVSERLGVRAVLMGSVRRAGARVRVTAQLVNGADGMQLWADRFDRTMDDLFAVQDEIAESITTALRGTLLTPSAPLSAPRTPADPDAYSAYLRGGHLLNRRTAQDMKGAREWFQRAIDLDGQFAAAQAGLAHAWALLGVYGDLAPQESFVVARRAANLALRLDPSLSSAHAVLGLIQAGHDWDFMAAEASFKASLAGTPEATANQWLATMVLLPQRRFDEAFVAVRRALKLDPLSLSARSTLTVALLYARRFEEAVHAARETLELEPRFAVAHFFHAQALAALGEHAGAVAAAEQASELSGNSGECMALAAFTHGLNGNIGRAVALSDELRARVGQRYVADSHLALAAIGAGDTERALDLLERAVDSRVTDMIWLRVRPVWDVVRDTARFREIVNRIAS